MNRVVAQARLRIGESAAQNLNHATTYSRSLSTRIEEETVGIAGEWALARLLGIDWEPPLNTFHTIPDVGCFEARATHRPNGCLIVRSNDPADRVYVLLTGPPPTMTLRGCIRGAAAKQDRFRRDPNGWRPAWFVPQACLYRLELPVGTAVT